MTLDAYCESNPPDESDPFAWSVGLHNAVNAKLEKPQVTADAARERWG